MPWLFQRGIRIRSVPGAQAWNEDVHICIGNNPPAVHIVSDGYITCPFHSWFAGKNPLFVAIHHGANPKNPANPPAGGGDTVRVFGLIPEEEGRSFSVSKNVLYLPIGNGIRIRILPVWEPDLIETHFLVISKGGLFDFTWQRFSWDPNRRQWLRSTAYDRRGKENLNSESCTKPVPEGDPMGRVWGLIPF